MLKSLLCVIGRMINAWFDDKTMFLLYTVQSKSLDDSEEYRIQREGKLSLLEEQGRNFSLFLVWLVCWHNLTSQPCQPYWVEIDFYSYQLTSSIHCKDGELQMNE